MDFPAWPTNYVTLTAYVYVKKMAKEHKALSS